MIKKLAIKNFKSLKDINLELSNLNLLTGLNGSGKSTVIQALLLLRQSKISLQEDKKLTLSKTENSLFDAGTDADVFYQFGSKKQIEFSLDCAQENNAKALVWKFKAGSVSDADNNYLKAAAQPKAKDFENLALFADTQFTYLNAERIAPQDLYKKNPDAVDNKDSIGTFGEYTAHYLLKKQKEAIDNIFRTHQPKADSSSLLNVAQAWLSEISPNSYINVEDVDTEHVKINYQFGFTQGSSTIKTNTFKPKNVGFGISYVLPVIVALLTAKENKLIIIENPESHIHPRGQAELGRLIALAANTGAQIIVETHSDHILNGIRVAVKQAQVAKENVAIFFASPETVNSINENENKEMISTEVFSKFHHIRIDKFGELSDYPPHFLDEWSNQLYKLI